MTDEFLAQPSEDALAYSSDGDKDDDIPSPKTKRFVAALDSACSASSQEDDPDKDSLSNWGPSKSAYYAADNIETEQDALNEEAEARRIQQKRLKALQESDFGFDDITWTGACGDHHDEGYKDEEGGVVTEVLPQVQITPGMSDEEKVALLQKRYPEFEPLAREMLKLRPIWERLVVTRKEIIQKKSSMPARKMLTIRFRALSAYLGSLAMYFALLSSPARNFNYRDGQNEMPMPLSPSELRDHPVMFNLSKCREIWNKTKDLAIPVGEDQGPLDEHERTLDVNKAFEDVDVENQPNHQFADDKSRSASKNPDKRQTVNSIADTASKARRAARVESTEASLAELTAQLSQIPKHKPGSKSAQNANGSANHEDSLDLGDEPALPPYEAAEKARRRKSLRFYTSQIAQRDTRMGRGGHGDEDVPHRERLKDRAERLTREAVRRGREVMSDEQVLGDSGRDSYDDDPNVVKMSNRERRSNGGEDEYAALLERRVETKKEAKRAREAAYAGARMSGDRLVSRVTHDQQDSQDGKRGISFAIEKNRGLTPKRKNEVTNPRVKKRKKFEDKSKKLRSMKPFWKGGEGRGGYGGEVTGIKKGLVKSVKF